MRNIISAILLLAAVVVPGVGQDVERPGGVSQPMLSGGGAYPMGHGLVSPGTYVSSDFERAVRRTSRSVPTSGVRRLVPQEYATIQGAIDASSDGDTVLVLEGTYKENIRYRGKAIVVGSLYLIDGDASHVAKTIINGSHSTHRDSGSVVYFVDGEDTTSVLCGLTITGGTGTTSYYAPGNNTLRLGGGILCWNSGARVFGNIISRNKVIAPAVPSPGLSAANGGGLMAIDLSSTPCTVILESNLITDNIAYGSRNTWWMHGGGAAFFSVNGRIVGNVFERDSVISNFGGAGGGVTLGIADLGYLLPAVSIERNLFRSNVVTVASQGAIGVALCLVQTEESTISGNLFQGNIGTSPNGWAQGGGLCLDDQHEATYGQKMILKNRFWNNRLRQGSLDPQSGGGLLLYRTLATVDGNEIADNVADYGGGGIAAYSSAIRIQNNIITRNSSQQAGGGMDLRGGTEQLIVNNTVVNNSASLYGGGLYVASAPQTVCMNNIFWNNSAGRGGPEISSSQIAGVAYCDVKGGWPGTGNIDADPAFVAGDPQFHLTANSPCVGAGIDSAQVGGVCCRAPTCDCGMMQRAMPGGTRPDMGAQEEQTSALACACDVKIDRAYARPGVEPVYVTAVLTNPKQHTAALSATVTEGSKALVDSVLMYDDGLHGDGAAGDGVWGCHLPAPSREGMFGVDVCTADQTQGASRRLPNAAQFTTAGPVIVDSLVTERLTSRYVVVKIWLKNAGTDSTVKWITGTLWTTDPQVLSMLSSVRNCGNLTPGTRYGVGYSFKVDTSLGSADIPFTVDVSSNGVVYWTPEIMVQVPPLTGVIASDSRIPTDYRLEQNYPNPFNPSTTIRYALPRRSHVSLAIYNTLGQKVRTLVDEVVDAGYQSVELNASGLASGVYFYRIQTGDFTQVKRLMLLK